jgi:hypothetical protein
MMSRCEFPSFAACIAWYNGSDMGGASGAPVVDMTAPVPGGAYPGGAWLLAMPAYAMALSTADYSMVRPRGVASQLVMTP